MTDSPERTGSEPPEGPFRPHDSSSKWGRREAAHLLWRAQYGATHEEIEAAAGDGLAKTLDRLLTPQKESDEFRSTESLLRRVALDTGNIANLKAWWLYRMTYSANPLLEKMSLLWHSHFATSNAKVQSVKQMLAQNDLIRRHAVGSFRKLLHGMARDVAMLVWLDGNANRKRQPNENFAREVMELFSLGEGNYTEKDIVEAARAFTGWHVRKGEFWLNRIQHDNGEKTVLGRSGNLDGDDVVDLCLEQPACARFLASKLLGVFALHRAAAELVEGLAKRIRAHDFKMAPVLREILGSRLFFSLEARHAIIKSPLDLVLGSHRTLASRANLQETVGLLSDLGQDVFEPPTVKGWEGGRLWITSASLLVRNNFAAELSSGDRYGPIADTVRLAEARGWKEPEPAVRHYVDLLLNRNLDAAVLARLGDYLRQADGSREQRLRGLIHLVMTMPEYQLG